MSVYTYCNSHFTLIEIITGLVVSIHADIGQDDQEATALHTIPKRLPQHRSSGSDSGAYGDHTSSCGSPTTSGTLHYKCGCGKCTIHEYLKDETCQNPIREFPHLDIQGDSYEAQCLEQTLTDQTHEIGLEFAGLLRDTFDRLTQLSDQTFHHVQQHIKRLISPATYGHMFIMSDQKGDIITIATANDYMQLEDALLKSYCSWFNFGIITEIRKAFLFSDTDNDQAFSRYECKFSAYCKRRCFESPKTFHPIPQGRKTLVFKIDKDFQNFTLKEVQHIKKMVVTIIDCPQYAVLSLIHI